MSATTITRVRSVLLSAPYGDPISSAENRLHLPRGLRTCGLVEITLSDGTVGLGEGYLAVFAPRVFESIVALLEPLLLGRDARDITARFHDIVTATGYWSVQGAARHVISAVEIALQDCNARLAGLPLYAFLGAPERRALEVYASGGDSVDPAAMKRELDSVAQLGITTFKIRGRAHQADKVTWTQRAGKGAGIKVAVDMTQNLVAPSHTPEEVLRFLSDVSEGSGDAPVFLEEVLGPDRITELPALRALSSVPIAGGEIVTTEVELIERIRIGSYDLAQPDATVIGGIQPVLDVFAAARQAKDVSVYVHCWGGGVGVLANYHASLAGGGTTVEWPLPSYPLRAALLEGALEIDGGLATVSAAPGLGIVLSADIEREFPFREDAVYDCLVDPVRIPAAADWR
ncbi:mandelate racemase/muconate lactonizing enzyme family protein [Rhodoglobus aureus]|uniref:D-galactarolactone cycloisomerase n=1 Tax=Rhodoglobus aureus TaxID=191497 RepID=A0ABP4G4H5_9MICO